MKQIFLLSKENIDLSRQEVLNLLDIKKHTLIKNLLIAENKSRLITRLAYTKKVYELLFESNYKDLEDKLKKYNFNKKYKKNFCLRIDFIDNDLDSFTKKIDKQNPEKHFGSMIWHNIKKPKVKLDNPETLFQLLITKNKLFCTRLLYQNKEDFESRKPHKKPYLMPTSLNPRLARALVNLSGSKTKITDPFCGVGGILVEAGLMKLKTQGYDINNFILKKCRQNMDHYKIKDYQLTKKDSLKISKKIDYIVTDLPYGISSRDFGKALRNKKNLKDFYLKFLINLKTILKTRAVIVFPDFIKHRPLIKRSKLKMLNEFSYYIHKSLTKKIIILE